MLLVAIDKGDVKVGHGKPECHYVHWPVQRGWRIGVKGGGDLRTEDRQVPPGFGALNTGSPGVLPEVIGLTVVTDDAPSSAICGMAIPQISREVASSHRPPTGLDSAVTQMPEIQTDLLDLAWALPVPAILFATAMALTGPS